MLGRALMVATAALRGSCSVCATAPARRAALAAARLRPSHHRTHVFPPWLTAFTSLAPLPPKMTVVPPPSKRPLADDGAPPPPGAADGAADQPAAAAAVAPPPAKKTRRKKQTPEILLRNDVSTAARAQDVAAALAFYDAAVAGGMEPPTDVANIVLYLCAGGHDWDAELAVAAAAVDGNAAPATTPPDTNTFASRGLAIFDSLKPRFPLPLKDGEMAHTAVARIAARARDAPRALAAARAAVDAGLPPRLRCFAPALMAFCADGNATAAFEVDAEVCGHKLDWGEADLARLLAVAARAPAGSVPWPAIESVLNRLTREHGRLAPATLAAARALFASPAAAAALPAGKAWRVTTAAVDAANGDVVPADDSAAPPIGRLVGIDLTDDEWAAFADGIAALARSRERYPSNFDDFTAWLAEHGPFDAVIDGANVALFGQNWDLGGFDFGQVAAVLDALRAEKPDLKPLVIFHKSRTGAPPAREPVGRAFLAALRADNALYVAPHGSNDDWYWLHAAVAARGAGLLVSNDEMRDHVFALLAPRFVSRWKERHQCYYVFDYEGELTLTLPRPFSVCAQWVAPADAPPHTGAWVLPPEGDDAWDGWLCARVVDA